MRKVLVLATRQKGQRIVKIKKITSRMDDTDNNNDRELESESEPSKLCS